MKNNEYSFEDFFAAGTGNETQESYKISTEGFDGYNDELSKDLQESIEQMNFLDAYSIIDKMNSDQKIRMLKKIQSNYNSKTISRENLGYSIESYTNQYIQSQEGIISKFGKFLITCVKTIINVIVKCITVISSFISGFFTEVANATEPSQEKIKVFEQSLKDIGKIESFGKESLDKAINKGIVDQSSLSSKDSIKACAEKIYNLLDKTIFNYNRHADWDNYNDYAKAIAVSCIMSENIKHSTDKVLEVVNKSIEKTNKYLQETITLIKKDKLTNSDNIGIRDINLKGRELYFELKDDMENIHNYKSSKNICDKENIINTLQYFVNDIKEKYTVSYGRSFSSNLRKINNTFEKYTVNEFKKLERFLVEKESNGEIEKDENISKRFHQMNRTISFLTTLLSKMASTFESREKCLNIIRKYIKDLSQDSMENYQYSSEGLSSTIIFTYCLAESLNLILGNSPLITKPFKKLIDKFKEKNNVKQQNTYNTEYQERVRKEQEAYEIIKSNPEIQKLGLEAKKLLDFSNKFGKEFVKVFKAELSKIDSKHYIDVYDMEDDSDQYAEISEILLNRCAEVAKAIENKSKIDITIKFSTFMVDGLKQYTLDYETNNDENNEKFNKIYYETIESICKKMKLNIYNPEKDDSSKLKYNIPYFNLEWGGDHHGTIQEIFEIIKLDFTK